MALSLVRRQLAPLFQGSKSQSQAGSAHPLPSGWVMGSQVSTVTTATSTTLVRPLPGHTAEAPRGVPAPAFPVAARNRCSPAPVVPPVRPLPFSIARPALPPPPIKQSRTTAMFHSFGLSRPSKSPHTHPSSPPWSGQLPHPQTNLHKCAYAKNLLKMLPSFLSTFPNLVHLQNPAQVLGKLLQHFLPALNS